VSVRELIYFWADIGYNLNTRCPIRPKATPRRLMHKFKIEPLMPRVIVDFKKELADNPSFALHIFWGALEECWIDYEYHNRGFGDSEEGNAILELYSWPWARNTGKRGRPSTKRDAAIQALFLRDWLGLSWPDIAQKVCPDKHEHNVRCQKSLENTTSELRVLVHAAKLPLDVKSPRLLKPKQKVKQISSDSL
jgi:hypothetical protein